MNNNQTVAAPANASSSAISPRLFAGALVIASLILAMAAWFAYEETIQHREMALSRTRNLATVLERYVDAVFDKADMAMTTLAFEYENQKMVRGGNEAALNKLIAHQLAQVPDLENISIASADGISWSRTTDGKRFSVADRDYFQRARDGPGRDLVFSEPLFGRVRNKWVVVLARRLNRSDGSFAGVVYATIASEHFSGIFATIDLGKDGAISLRSAGLRLVARHPELPGAVSAIGTDTVSAQLREAIAANPVGGDFASQTSLDGKERVNTYRRITSYPFYVVVGISAETWRTEARDDVIGVATLAGLAVVLTAVFSWLLHRAWTRRELALVARSQESEKNILLWRNTSDGLHILDGDGNVVEASDSFCAMLGRTHAEVLRMNVSQWDAQWAVPESAAKFHAMIHNRDNILFETRHRRQDGRTFDVEINAVAISYDGRMALFCSARNITQRKIAEQAVSVSEHRLAIASEAGEVGMWDLDLATGNAWRSPRHATIFGYQSSEGQWSRDQLLLHIVAQDREFVTRQLDDAPAKGHVQYECRIVRADDAVRWIAVRGEIFRDEQGRPVHMMGTSIDITDRKEAEAVLLLQEKIIQNMKEGVCLIQADDGKIVFANPTFETMFGYNKDELTRTHIRTLYAPSIIPPREIAAEIKAALDQRQYWEGDVHNLRKDGTMFWCHATVTRMVHPQYGMVWLGVQQDITERKQAETAIIALKESLEVRVGERTTELQKTHDELRALTAAVESFQEDERKHIARELHDELAQKLTVLKLNFRVLKSTLPAGQPELTGKLDNINQLLGDTMDAVRKIAHNLRPAVLDELGLVPAVQDLVDEFSQRNNMDCEFCVIPADLTVDSRLASHLYRMVQESLTNIERHAEASKAVVSLNGESQGKLMLEINDNGKGIGSALQHKAKSFGLIGMRERVAILGGEIAIRSEPGAGTSIKIVIPHSRKQPVAGVLVKV